NRSKVSRKNCAAAPPDRRYPPLGRYGEHSRVRRHENTLRGNVARASVGVRRGYFDLLRVSDFLEKHLIRSNLERGEPWILVIEGRSLFNPSENSPVELRILVESHPSRVRNCADRFLEEQALRGICKVDTPSPSAVYDRIIVVFRAKGE